MKKANRDGLYKKYRIHKADGTPLDPSADYFVLRLDTDVAARQAAYTYANAIQPELPTLAAELVERIKKYAVDGETMAYDTYETITELRNALLEAQNRVAYLEGKTADLTVLIKNQADTINALEAQDVRWLKENDNLKFELRQVYAVSESRNEALIEVTREKNAILKELTDLKFLMEQRDDAEEIPSDTDAVTYYRNLFNMSLAILAAVVAET